MSFPGAWASLFAASEAALRLTEPAARSSSAVCIWQAAGGSDKRCASDDRAKQEVGRLLHQTRIEELLCHPKVKEVMSRRTNSKTKKKECCSDVPNPAVAPQAGSVSAERSAQRNTHTGNTVAVKANKAG